jgi:basic amino acid/polyamine antiporter, APA family
VGIRIAGPGIILSFLVAGLVCTLAALCYAELASMMPPGSNIGTLFAFFLVCLGVLVLRFTSPALNQHIQMFQF